LTQREFLAVIERIAKLVGVIGESKVAIYPPARPKSEYIRTGTLGRKITSNVYRQSPFIRTRIGAYLSYAPYVIGDDDQSLPVGERQAYMHRGVWEPMSVSIQKSVSDMEAALDAELDKAVKAFLP
jgi:hypothetical protein